MTGFVMPADAPARIQTLPRNDAGYPVPWFVKWIDGVPDFRVIDEDRFVKALKEPICWICGEQRGAYKAFVIGPMCAINRVSSEPPSHTDCATFAARMCPFLANPKQKRRETNLPSGQLGSAGIAIKRNPGVALVWVTKQFGLFGDGNGGVLFRIGPPENVLWFAHGREATHDEVMESIQTGYPLLREMADKDGPEAVLQLNEQYRDAMVLVPA